MPSHRHLNDAVKLFCVYFIFVQVHVSIFLLLSAAVESLCESENRKDIHARILTIGLDSQTLTTLFDYSVARKLSPSL